MEEIWDITTLQLEIVTWVLRCMRSEEDENGAQRKVSYVSSIRMHYSDKVDRVLLIGVVIWIDLCTRDYQAHLLFRLGRTLHMEYSLRSPGSTQFKYALYHGRLVSCEEFDYRYKQTQST
jgi:hypothetical protein